MADSHDINIEELFYTKLDLDLIAFNYNKNPIKMDMFLGFLKFKIERSKNHLGSNNGWTKLESKNHQLIVMGGCVDGIEYLNSIKYKTNLHNVYNNFVTPFQMFNLLTKEGRLFFLDYYGNEISEIISNKREEAKRLEHSMKQAQKELLSIKKEYQALKNISK